MVRVFSTQVDIVKQTVTAQDVYVQQVPNEKVEFINADSATTIASGGSETITIQAPAGYIYEFLAMRLSVVAPGGAASGIHTFTLKSETEMITLLSGQSNFGSDLEYEYGYWVSADSKQRPTGEIGQITMPRKLRFDENNGLNIIYYNDTDVDQTGSRLIRLMVRKIKVS